MAAPQIVSGAFPYTARGTAGVGTYLADQNLTSVGGFAGTSGTASASFALAGGTLTIALDPDDASTVLVSGTPTQAGLYTFTIRVTNGNGSSDYQAQLFCYNPGGDGYTTLLPANITGGQIISRTDGWFYLVTVPSSTGVIGNGISATANRLNFICFDNNAVPQWSATAGTFASTGSEWLFTTDTSNSLYILADGATNNVTFYNATGATAFSSNGASGNWRLMKLSATGVWQWVNMLSVGTGGTDARRASIAAGSSFGYVSAGLGSTRAVTLGSHTVGTVAAWVARFDLSSGTFTRTIATATDTGFGYIYCAARPNDDWVIVTSRSGASGATLTFPNGTNQTAPVGKRVFTGTSAGANQYSFSITSNGFGTHRYLAATATEIIGVFDTATNGTYTLNTSPTTAFTASAVDAVIWRKAWSDIAGSTLSAAARTSGTGSEFAGYISRYGDNNVMIAGQGSGNLNAGTGPGISPTWQSVWVAWWNGSDFQWIRGAWTDSSARTLALGNIQIAHPRANGPTGLLGGTVVPIVVQGGTGTTNVNLINESSIPPEVVNIPTTGSRLLLATISTSGVWKKTDATVTAPPGGSGAGGDAFSPPNPPSSSDWPASGTEEAGFFATVTGTDPEFTTVNPPLYALEVWNGSSNTWTAVPFGTEDISIAGRGTLTVTASTNANAQTANVIFNPNADWYGTLTVYLRWRAYSPAKGTRYSSATKFRTVFGNILEPPTTPTGTMPDANEDSFSQATWTTTDPDRTGSYTWQLSPQTSAPSGWPSGTDFHTVTGSSVSIYNPSNPAQQIGTASVQSQNNSNRTAVIRFTPVANWHGNASFDIRVSNGNGWSDWTTANVTINPVPDPPSAISPTTFPDINEDETDTSLMRQVFSWSDPDAALSPTGNSYVIQMALDVASPSWVDVDVDDSFDIGNVILRLISINSDTRQATVQVEPKANWNGTYAVKMRIKDTSDSTDLFGPVATVTGTIVSVPDVPSRVQPTLMPKTKPGKTVSQVFTTTDPDTENTSWTFTVSATETGTYSSSTSTALGTITVSDSDSTDKAATVLFSSALGAYGRYEFWIRATDNTGLSSVPTRVTGYVTGVMLGAMLQRVSRSSTGATVASLCPIVSVLNLEITDALDGPGSARLTVASQEPARRAADLNMSVSDLLAPSSVELVVLVGTQPLWVGPISGHSFDPTGEGEVTIDASGLLGYFEARNVVTSSPTAKRQFVNTDQSSIAWTLINESQGAEFGHLCLVDGTTPSGTNSTLSWDTATTITSALRDLRRLAGSAEVWIDAERNVRSAATRGLDARNRVRITDGMITSITRETSWDGLVTAAVVTGAETTTPDVYFTGTFQDPIAMAKYGRVVRTVEAKQLVSDASCAALAQEVVRRNSTPVEKFQIEVEMNPLRLFSLSDIEVGNVITLDVEDRELGRVFADVRIINRTVSLVSDASDSFVVRLEVETAVWVDGVLQGSRSRHVAELYDQVTEVMYAQ